MWGAVPISALEAHSSIFAYKKMERESQLPVDSDFVLDAIAQMNQVSETTRIFICYSWIILLMISFIISVVPLTDAEDPGIAVL